MSKTKIFEYPKLLYSVISVFLLADLYLIIKTFYSFQFNLSTLIFPTLLLLLIYYLPIQYPVQFGIVSLSFAFPILIIYGTLPIVIVNLITLFLPGKEMKKLILIKRVFNSLKQIFASSITYFLFYVLFINELLPIELIISLCAFVYSLLSIMSIGVVVYLEKKYNYFKHKWLNILDVLFTNLINGLFTYFLFHAIGKTGIVLGVTNAVFLSMGVKYQVDYYKQKKELYKSEQNAQVVLNTIDYGVITVDTEDRITSANPIALTFLKTLHQHPIGVKLNELKPDYSKEIYQLVLTSLQTQKGYHQKRVASKIKDELRYFDIHTYPVRAPEGLFQGIILLYKNVTEEQFMRKQLIETDKMSRIGQIAASKVHEIKNPLTTVRGYLQMLRKKLERNESLKLSTFDVMIQEIDRTNDLINSLLILSKQSEEKMDDVNLGELIYEIIDLFMYQIEQKNIQFSYKIEEELWILGRENQLKQIFINMILNAMDAVTDNVQSPYIHINVAQRKEDIIIDINDNGIGISEENLKKLSQPFFTTKEHGTGLGLFVTYQLINQLKGSVCVTSKLNQGTNFSIVFPKIEANDKNKSDAHSLN